VQFFAPHCTKHNLAVATISRSRLFFHTINYSVSTSAVAHYFLLRINKPSPWCKHLQNVCKPRDLSHLFRLLCIRLFWEKLKKSVCVCVCTFSCDGCCSCLRSTSIWHIPEQLTADYIPSSATFIIGRGS